MKLGASLCSRAELFEYSCDKMIKHVFFSHNVKISIAGPCSRGPFPSLDTKNAGFQANFPKNRASNKGPPTNIEEKSVLRYAETSQICYQQGISSRPPPTNCPSK